MDKYEHGLMVER